MRPPNEKKQRISHRRARLKQDVRNRSAATKRALKGRRTADTYEKGDMREIANSIDPYKALFEMGLIKSASEFFNKADT